MGLDRLAKAVECGDAVPFGVLEATALVVAKRLAVRVAGTRGREAKAGDVSSTLGAAAFRLSADVAGEDDDVRSEEHTSELQSLMRISYAVFCVKKKKKVLIDGSTIGMSHP